MGTVTTIGLDLAKNIFQVHGVDDVGNVVLRRTLRRKQVADFFAQLPPCLVAMESCSTSQFWARRLAELGHQPRLIPPQFVKPYLMTNKNDANDAAAICEAVRRPQMRFVPLKTRDQQSILAVHRVREGWIKARTACANQIRALMAEAGVVLPQGISQIFRNAGERVTDPVKGVPDLIRDLVLRLLEHVRYLQQRIAELELIIEVWHRRNGDSQRLAAIPGIGVITATALVRRSAMRDSSRAGGNSLRGLGSCRDSTLLEAKGGFSASASEVMSTSAHF